MAKATLSLMNHRKEVKIIMIPVEKQVRSRLFVVYVAQECIQSCCPVVKTFSSEDVLGIDYVTEYQPYKNLEFFSRSWTAKSN
jgi:hypothetical protein